MITNFEEEKVIYIYDSYYGKILYYLPFYYL